MLASPHLSTISLNGCYPTLYKLASHPVGNTVLTGASACLPAPALQPLYAPLPIPAALLEAAEGCGADIFAFLQADLRARYAPGHTQPAAEYTDAMA